ncbi:MAG: Na+/H+ antiporter NhaA [Acetobacteraceae bacterium]
MLEFLASGSAGGGVLILSGAAALIWANSASSDVYFAILRQRIGPEPVHIWINDGLMAIFFLLVGLELRREITRGELASPSRLAAPALAALGGMVVPAIIFCVFNWSDPVAMRGWAVPVATDIAFALAVLSVLGSRVPVGLKVFLTALAIIDDLGAIVVIALFYTRGLDLWMLGAALLLLFMLWGLGRAGVRSLVPYLLGGTVLWVLMFRSGVHATLSGVALAFVIPMEPRGKRPAPALRLEHRLNPWVAYAILPLFGLANAGLRFDTLPAGAWTERLAIGTTVALVLGKQVGVFGAALASARLGLARLPAGGSLGALYGAAVLCGIGFTMSLFIGDLAFRQTPRGDEVKLAVFAASLISAAWGLLILGVVHRPAVVARGGPGPSSRQTPPA